MKKLLATTMAVTLMLGAASGAHANWFNKDKSKDETNARIETKSRTYGNGQVEVQRNVYGDRNPDTQQNVRVGNKRMHIETPVGYDATANNAEAQKWTYNGSSAYRGGLSGQIAVRDNMNDGDGMAMVTRPVRGANNQFNASLRNGDMGQSAETRLNHAFNN